MISVETTVVLLLLLLLPMLLLLIKTKTFQNIFITTTIGTKIEKDMLCFYNQV